MKTIRMLTTMRSPSLNADPGDVLVVRPGVAKPLIEGGCAVELKPHEVEAEEAAAEEPEAESTEDTTPVETTEAETRAPRRRRSPRSRSRSA